MDNQKFQSISALIQQINIPRHRTSGRVTESSPWSQKLWKPAVRFLKWTFRNVSMFALENATFACGVRSARDVNGCLRRLARETEVGRRSLPPPLAPEPRPLAACKPKPNLNQWPPRALFCLKVDNSCCYARYSCEQLKRCRQTRARVQVFWRILLPSYGNSSPRTIRFLLKRTVTSERSR